MDDVPAGIDVERLTGFLSGALPGFDGEVAVRMLSGGRSNLTYLVRVGGRDIVLRRPPLGHVLPTAHDMAREFRVLSGLAGTDVPAPRPIALCEDREVLGVPFYLMEYAPGIVINETWVDGFCETHEERQRLSASIVDALVRLHCVEPEAVGLGDFGRPQGFVARQVRRWGEQWERSKTRDLPALDELVRRLQAAVPEEGPPAIVHGDYRLGNLALNDRCEVAAIFDWEMATLGDPLTDLGWLLSQWEQAPEGGVAGFTGKPGFFTRGEVVEEYGRRSGRPVHDVDYYLALAYFKNAVIVEGIWARHLQGKTVGEGFERFDRCVPLIERALQVCEASTDPRLRGTAG